MRRKRDSETGMDYFNARHYTSQYGRFLQPDPAGMAAVDPSNPQSWNQYAYVGGNPLNFTDPTGMDWVANFTDKTNENGDDPTSWRFTTYTLTQLRFVVSLVPHYFYLVPGTPGTGFVDQDGYGLAGTYMHIPGPGDLMEPCSDYGCPPTNTDDGGGGGGGAKTTIGPPKPPTPPRPVSDTDKYLSYLGCLAGLDPGIIDPENGDMTPTDSAPGSLGQRTAKFDGRKRALNPGGSKDRTPDNTADAAAWLSGAARCAAIVHGWPTGGKQ